MSFLLDEMGLDKMGLDEMGWHLFRTPSDGKLVGTWERGYDGVTAPRKVLL